MSESDIWWAIATAGLTGILLGMWWGKWTTWGYIKSKTPDAVGWRTAFHLDGKFYYVVSEREYVGKVMGPINEAQVEAQTTAARFSDLHPHGAP